MPYISNEDQFLEALKQCINSEPSRLRLIMWKMNHIGLYAILNDEGKEKIKKEFANETEEY